MEDNAARKLNQESHLRIEKRPELESSKIPEKSVEFYFGKIKLIVRNYPGSFLIAVTVIFAATLIALVLLHGTIC